MADHLFGYYIRSGSNLGAPHSTEDKYRATIVLAKSIFKLDSENAKILASHLENYSSEKKLKCAEQPIGVGAWRSAQTE